MKRFIGLFLLLLGVGLILWGGYHCLIGQSTSAIQVTNDFKLSAMTGGLAGLAIFTTGFIWMRD
jgi:hypothetical protein